MRSVRGGIALVGAALVVAVVCIIGIGPDRTRVRTWVSEALSAANGTDSVPGRSVPVGATSLEPARAALLEDLTGESIRQPGEPRPECQRTMRYRMAGAHGFGSEYAIFIRWAAIAEYLGYTILADDEKWNYGKVSDYFSTASLDCTPPADWRTRPRTRVRRARGTTSLREGVRAVAEWANIDHVDVPRDVDLLDAITLRFFVDSGSLSELHVKNLESLPMPPLKGDGVVPSAFRLAFRVQATALQSIFNLNTRMQEIVDHAVATIRAADKTDNSVDPITIAVHLRLGDKIFEVSKFLPENVVKSPITHVDLRPGAPEKPIARLNAPNVRPGDKSAIAAHREATINAHLTAARDLYKSLSASMPAKNAHRPRMVIASDDASGARLLRQRAGPSWDVFILNEIPIKSDNVAGGKALANGFKEGAFNGLSETSRVAFGSQLLRDIITLSTVSDGLVFTGSSNVGSILPLLFGAGRVLDTGAQMLSSCDVRWHPTSRFT